MEGNKAAACKRGFNHLQLLRVQPQWFAAVRTRFSKSFKPQRIFRNSLDRIFVFFHGSTQVETCLLKVVCFEDNHELEGFFSVLWLGALIDHKSVFT